MGLGNTFSRVAGGELTGGMSELLGYKGGNPLDLLNPNKQTLTQVPMIPPDQQAARDYISSFIKNGGVNGYNAGESYTGSLGDFNMSPTEAASGSKLAGLIQGGLPEIFRQGSTGLSSLISGNEFNPLAEGSTYQPFKDEVQRNVDSASADLKNKAAFGNNLYSTRTVQNLGNVQGQGQAALTSKLADLFQNFTQQRVNGIMAAPGYAQAGQTLTLNPIQAGFQYGGLQRDLNTQGANATMSEWLRSRQDKLMPLNAAQGLANTHVDYGVPSVDSYSPSNTMQLLQLALQGAGAYFGAKK